jgi:hypothetical protein
MDRSGLKVRRNADGELFFVFTNGPAANFPSVEAFVRPYREGAVVRSFSFAVYAYPADANPDRAMEGGSCRLPASGSTLGSSTESLAD